MNNETLNNTLKIVLKKAQQQLQNSPTGFLDAEVLLGHVLAVDRVVLYTKPNITLTVQQLLEFEKLIKRRQQDEPVAYIIGHKEFWSLDLRVDKNVLIPRPETELLIEQALALFPSEKEIQLAELGTGSGAIALAIARERPNWEIIATDISAAALKIAQQNAGNLALNNVEFLSSDWCINLPKIKFDLIISNPPYIAENDLHLSQGDVKFEPRSALISGLDGLDAIREIAHQAKSYLTSGGVLLLEHGYQQAKEVKEILSNEEYRDIVILKDLSGHDRIVKAVKLPVIRRGI